MTKSSTVFEDVHCVLSERIATLEKDNLRLRLEQAKFRTALEKISSQPRGLDYEKFAKHTANRALGRKKH